MEASVRAHTLMRSPLHNVLLNVNYCTYTMLFPLKLSFSQYTGNGEDVKKIL